MAKKKHEGLGHKFTTKERAAGRHQADIDELVDEQLLMARDAVHQYVSMIADSIAENGGKQIPADFLTKRPEIVGKIVRLVGRELKAYLKKAYAN